MSRFLVGKIAFVTGASRGMGRTISNHLADAGALGLGFDWSPDFDDLPRDWISHQGDVSDENSQAEAVETIRAKFGRLDILVANAGLVPPWSETETIDLEEWDRVFAVNVRGVIASIKQTVPLMKDTGGSIVVMGSLASHRANSRQCLYTATKHAVLGIVRATALDLGRFGIRVNALGPGPIATQALLDRIQTRSEHGGPAMDDALRELCAETALGRLATEDEVANAAIYLASDLSSGFSGQLFPIDAGLA